ncbi:MAG: hypothetical protein RID11_19225 [Roseovarius sp.]|jgi:hypothetical protein|uniref:hypothetical protein n=1 Tax=Roseovarius sp. TaxID=1486281 RepID=UPI0032EABE8D
MTIYTANTQNINFRDYMAMPSGMDFERLFDVLNDHGITVANTADDFLDALDEEDVIYEMDDLGAHLEFYARYLQAKVKGFESLRNDGIDAIFAAADYSANLTLTARSGAGVSGSWCRKDGVLYIVYGDMVDTTAASAARIKRSRSKADKETAVFWLRQLAQRKAEMQRDAA